MGNSALSATSIIEFPAGMIMPYAGTSVPAGWLECNGAEIDIASYPTLAAALGSTWNTAKNPLTGANYVAPAVGKFRVPDMRGAFLRGSTSGANNAQGVATALAEFQTQKTSKNGLIVTGGTSSLTGTTTFGSNGHNHYEGDLKAAIGATGGSADAIGYVASTPQPRGPSGVESYTVFGSSSTSLFRGFNHHTPVYGTTAGNNQSASVGLSTSAASINTGDAETRPDAVGVRYLIKY